MIKTYIWGTGKMAAYMFHAYSGEFDLCSYAGFIDNDPKKTGTIFLGKPVFPPSVLEQEKECRILILSGAYQEITRQIKESYPWITGKIDNPLLLTKHRLMSRYKKNTDHEIADLMNYLKDHDLQIFNYEFTSKYKDEEYKVEFDKEAGLYYTLFENKPMYFARYLNSEEKVSNYYKVIRTEQDINSPHRYLTEDFEVADHSVIVDAGVAEGNFALSVVDRAKKLYLFEPDSDWIEALQYTFAPYKDKVEIIDRYLSNFTNGDTVALDDFLIEEQVDFIKLDVEGEEYYALEGAKNTILQSDRIRCIACTYHQEFDFAALSELLKKFGMETEPSKGYMWFPYDKNPIYSLPTLRKGLVRAKKGEKI